MMTARRMGIGLLGVVLAGPVLLAPTAPAWAQAAVLNVPAGPLETVLLAIGRQAGVQFAYDSRLTQGRRSPGVRDARAPAQAVAQALAGTGLSHSFTGPAEVRIWAPGAQTAPAAAGAVVLDPVTLQAGGGRSEGSGAYSFDAPTATATGLALTARETPQAISVVTDQQIRDSGALVLKDTLNQTPGVNIASQFGDARWNYFARGSQISNLQYDGVAQPGAWWGQEGSMNEMVIYDRVEVVRGATGLKEGPGNPAASVNLVRKRPLDQAQTSLGTTAYDYGSASVTLDLSRVLSKDGAVRGRLLGYALGGDTWRAAQGHKTGLIYGALDIDLGPDTTLGLGLSRQADRIDGYAWGGFWLRPDGGAYDFGPRDNAGAAWEYLSRRQTVAYADLTHRLANGWDLRLAGRLADGKRDRLGGYGKRLEDGTLARDGYYAPGFEKSASIGATATGSIDAFGRSHDLAFGADWSRIRTGMKGDTFYTLPILDPSRPDTWAHPRPTRDHVVRWDTADSTTQWGLFASGRFEISPALHVITGGRLAWYDYKDVSGNPQEGPPNHSGFSVDAQAIPYLGLVYDLNDQWTAYASYTEIFLPQSAVDVRGSRLPPATGRNAELGLKASLLDGALNASVALYDTRQDGLPEEVTPSSLCAVPANGCSRPAETVTTRGLDFEINGAPAPGWNLGLGYTYADSGYSAGPNDGKRFNPDTVPRHLAKLNATYAFGGALEGLTLGGALRAQSGIYAEGIAANGALVRQRQGGYAVVDVMARYDLGQDTTLQVNVDNLLDRDYLTGLGVSWPNTFFGQPRTLSLTLNRSF